MIIIIVSEKFPIKEFKIRADIIFFICIQLLKITILALVLSYFNYKDDTYAKISKIHTWIMIILNILALAVLILFNISIVTISSSGWYNTSRRFCVIDDDGYESCDESAYNKTTKSIFDLKMIIISVSFLFSSVWLYRISGNLRTKERAIITQESN